MMLVKILQCEIMNYVLTKMMQSRDAVFFHSKFLLDLWWLDYFMKAKYVYTPLIGQLAN